ANDFASDTARPANGRSIKATPRPPFGIAASSVDRRLKATRQCLAKLIAGHQQSLAMRAAGSVKIKLLRIWPVIPEPILIYRAHPQIYQSNGRQGYAAANADTGDRS